MKVLIVASYNSNHFSPFVLDQAKALSEQGVVIDFFGISGKGMMGYYSNKKNLLRAIEKFNPNIIHAHYGLSGLLANLQRKIPVVTTFHGSDIYGSRVNYLLSKICVTLSAYNIFVHPKIITRPFFRQLNCSIGACGVDLNFFFPIERTEARKKIGWNSNDVYVAFSGKFDVARKNYTLAKAAMDVIGKGHLIELKDYSREEVNLIMNAVNLQLTTSFNETGPLVVKEAMACNCPIVSTNVGDVKRVIGHVEGCFLTSYEVTDCAEQIKKAIDFSIDRKNTNGRDRIIQLGLDNFIVAQKIISIYNQIVP